jgi:hypothetical protein
MHCENTGEVVRQSAYYAGGTVHETERERERGVGKVSRESRGKEFLGEEGIG